MDVSLINEGGKHVTIQCEHVAPAVHNHFPRYVKWLGTLQVLGGIVLLVLGVILGANGHTDVAESVFGVLFWVLMAGAFGLAAGCTRGTCEITTGMIMSTIASVTSCALVVVAIGQLKGRAEGQSTGTLVTTQPPETETAYPLKLTLLFVALIEAVVSIVSSAIGCQFSCICCKRCCCEFDKTRTERIWLKREEHERLLGLVALDGILQAQQPLQQQLQQCTSSTGRQQFQQQQPPQYSKLDA